MNLKILVTGASGLVGSHAVKALCENGYPVTVLYRKLDQRNTKYPWDTIQGDLLDKDILRRLGSVEFDLVVHCAAVLPNQFYGDQAEQAAQANSLMDERIISLCLNGSRSLVYMSSTSVYGVGTGSVLTEKHDISPMGPYAAAKVESEKKILNQLSGHSTILRLSSPYGPGQRTRTVLQLFTERALHNLDLMYHGTGQRQQDFIAANDVGSAIVSAISNANTNGIFNIASGNPISMRNLAELVVRAIPGTRSRVIPSGQPDPQDNYRAAFDISKARRTLGWYPTVPLDEGIRRWARYLREQE